MVAKNGSVDVITVINSQGGVTFIEKTLTGNIMTTSITDGGKSVHSRNSIVAGELVPSQYYGSCYKQ